MLCAKYFTLKIAMYDLGCATVTPLFFFKRILHQWSFHIKLMNRNFGKFHKFNRK